MTGVTELLLLVLLAHRDCYVYDVTKTIAASSGGLLRVSPNTLYTTAYKLVQEGYISEYTRQVGRKRTRVYYRIEPSGRTYLERLTEQYFQVSDGLEQFLQTAAQLNQEGGYEDGN